MKWLKSTLFIVSGCLIMTACTPKFVSNARLRDYKQRYHTQINPKPVKAYQIDIDVRNAPQGFHLVSGGGHYIMDCSKLAGMGFGLLSGKVAYTPKEYIRIPFTEIAPRRYRAIVYADYFVTGDYFNDGEICGWKEPSVNFIFQPNPDLSGKVYHLHPNLDEYVETPYHKNQQSRTTYYLNTYQYNEPYTSQYGQHLYLTTNTSQYGAHIREKLVGVEVVISKKF